MIPSSLSVATTPLFSVRITWSTTSPPATRVVYDAMRFSDVVISITSPNIWRAIVRIQRWREYPIERISNNLGVLLQQLFLNPLWQLPLIYVLQYNGVQLDSLSFLLQIQVLARSYQSPRFTIYKCTLYSKCVPWRWLVYPSRYSLSIVYWSVWEWGWLAIIMALVLCFLAIHWVHWSNWIFPVSVECMVTTRPS